MNCRTIALCLVMAGGWLGCGADPMVGGPVSVSGLILDGQAGFPALPGAQVSVQSVGAARTAMTGTDGSFTITGLPFGSAVVTISAQGHLGASFNVALSGTDGTAGSYNQAIGPIALLGSDSSLTVRLIDQYGGPASNVKTTARVGASFLDMSGAAIQTRGTTVVSATSGADGSVVFNGLPNLAAIGGLIDPTVTVVIPPFTLPGANGYAFGGFIQTLSLLTPGLNGTNITLAGPNTTLSVLGSNVPSAVLGNQLPDGFIVTTTGPLTYSFSAAIAPSSLRISIIDEFGAPAGGTLTPTVNLNQLSIALGAPLAPAKRYNITVYAHALTPNFPRDVSSVAAFFTNVPGAAVTATAKLDPLSTSDLLITFSEPVGIGGGAVATNLTCMAFYDVDLNGSSVIAPGEWTAAGNASLICNNNTAFVLQNREINSIAGAAVGTGFGTIWRIASYRSSCTATNCMQASAYTGKNLYLQYSRNPIVGQQFRRPDGSALPDLAVVMP